MAAENQSTKIFERSERTAREGLDVGAEAAAQATRQAERSYYHPLRKAFANLMLGCWTWRRPMAWRHWSSFAS
jgi:hypothetical protein